jgi:hypothetical protein
LGIGDWGLGPIPNPQSPIPNPQSPIPIFQFNIKNILIKKYPSKKKLLTLSLIFSRIYQIIFQNVIIK